MRQPFVLTAGRARSWPYLSGWLLVLLAVSRPGEAAPLKYAMSQAQPVYFFMQPVPVEPMPIPLYVYMPSLARMLPLSGYIPVQVFPAPEPEPAKPALPSPADCVPKPAEVPLDTTTPKGEASYALVLDAGSSSTKLLGAKFYPSPDGKLILDEAPSLYAKKSPGLSDFGENPEKGLDNIKELMVEADAFVPQEKRASTPLVLRATAGLRVIPEEQANALLDTVRAYLTQTEYNTSTTPDPAIIMSGGDEGIYGWVTVNYLMDLLYGDPKDMVAALDLGGSSTQVTMPITGEPPTNSPPEDIYPLKVGDHEIKLYSHSYPGMGANSARVSILSTAAANETALTSVCVDPIYNGTNLIVSGKTYIVYGTSSAEERLENCRGVVKEFISSNKVLTPEGILDHSVIAFSGFYYTALAAGLIESGDIGTVNVEDIQKATERVCSSSDSQPFVCVDILYIYTLLTDGYGFTPSTSFQVVQKLKDQTVSWTLGAAHQLLQGPI